MHPCSATKSMQWKINSRGEQFRLQAAFKQLHVEECAAQCIVYSVQGSLTLMNAPTSLRPTSRRALFTAANNCQQRQRQEAGEAALEDKG